MSCTEDHCNDQITSCDAHATCAQGGVTHCHQYERYPEALDDAGDGCCVPGCFLDIDGINVK